MNNMKGQRVGVQGVAIGCKEYGQEEIESMFDGAFCEIERIATEHLPGPFAPASEFAHLKLRVRPYAIDWALDEQQSDGTWRSISWGKTKPEYRRASRIASYSAVVKKEDNVAIPPPDPTSIQGTNAVKRMRC